MKNILFITLLTLLLPTYVVGQTKRAEYVEGGFKAYQGGEVTKFDRNNQLGADNLRDYDILKMLQMMGITSYTESFPKYDKIKRISLIVDEYKNQKIVKSDTLGMGENTFCHFSGDTIYNDYYNMFKIYLMAKEKNAVANIVTPSGTRGFNLKHCTDSLQEYHYVLRKWEYPDNFDSTKRKNILTYASMWLDKKHGFYRFCGVSKLKDNDDETKELLNNSPHYFTIGYILQ